MKLQCKCHGVSGACSMRTCWLAMQQFRLVATSLRRRYDGATRVQMAQDGSRLVVANRHHKRPTRSDLMYLEQSPDFCDFDPRTGASVLCRNHLSVLYSGYAVGHVPLVYLAMMSPLHNVRPNLHYSDFPDL